MGRQPGQLHVLHYFQGDHLLAFQFGLGAASWQGDYLPRPERRNCPFDQVALDIAVAEDVALFIHFLALGCDESGVEVGVCIGQADVIENDVEIAFTDEVAGLLGCFEVAAEVGAARECGATELGELAEVAEDRVANLSGFRGDRTVVYGAVEQGSCRDQG